jgi:hypothetical protein
VLLLGYVPCAQVLRSGVGVRRVVICEYVYDEALMLSVRAQHTLYTLESVSIRQRKYMHLLREYTCISFSAVYTQHCCVHTAHTHVHSVLLPQDTPYCPAITRRLAAGDRNGRPHTLVASGRMH